MDNTQRPPANPLGEKPISALLIQFAIPTIVSTLIGSLYNMVDQIFIGQRIGYLGNAATTVAYPLTILSGALTLLMSNGAGVNFNLLIGRGRKDEAMVFAGNGVTLLGIVGLSLAAVVGVFTGFFVRLFGATEEVAPYALIYMRIIALGLPFLSLTSGGTLLIRSDGSPRRALLCSLTGVGVNFLLDWLFLFPLNLGIAGAALATILGQLTSALMVLQYLRRFRTAPFARPHFRLSGARVRRIAAIGAAASLNQAFMMLMNMVLNHALKHYGDLSVYGGSEALAAAGVVTKVSFLIYSTIIGCSIGAQPIIGFNYGAGKYRRVMETYRLVLYWALFMGAVQTACFWLIPRQILWLFGGGAAGYEAFALRYMHEFLLLVVLAGVPPISMMVLSGIGQAKKGVVISMSKQLLLMLLLLILPRLFGIDGVLYAGPAADLTAAVCSFLVLHPVFQRLSAAP